MDIFFPHLFIYLLTHYCYYYFFFQGSFAVNASTDSRRQRSLDRGAVIVSSRGRERKLPTFAYRLELVSPPLT